MSRPIAESIQLLKNSLGNIKNALTTKEVEVPEETKVSEVSTLIESIDTGSKVELVVTAPDFEGQTLTATKGEKSVKGQVTEGIARIPVDEEGTWTVSSDDGTEINIETDMTFEGVLKAIKVYGVKIIKATEDCEARVTYIDKAVGKSPVKVDQSSGKANYNGWDQTWIFDKVYPVMLKNDGTEDYRLDPNDVTQKLEGGASDVDNFNYDGNAMVCYEKFYTKYSMDGEDNIIEICDEKLDGFEAIGFIREDGSEADKVYISMYGGNRDSSHNDKLRSLSGTNRSSYNTFNNLRKYAQNNGSGYDIETWAMNQMRNALWYVLMKNCDPWTAIGNGRENSDDQTGVTNKVGAIGFDTSSKAARFMWSEDYTSDKFSGISFWEAGILSQSSKIYVKMKPPYDIASTSEYTQVSDYVHGSNYISAMKCSNEFGRYPIVYGGSLSKYEASEWTVSKSDNIQIACRGRGYGIAGCYMNLRATDTSSSACAALTYLPPA